MGTSHRIFFAGLLILLTPPLHAQPVRLSMELPMGAKAEIEVRNLRKDLATKAIHHSLSEIHRLSLLLDPDSEQPGSLGALNAAAGKEAVAVDPLVKELLLRGLQFCIWSNGAYGPLGGSLYRFWEVSRSQGDLGPDAFGRALAGAACSQLSLDLAQDPPTAKLAAGSRVEAWGLAYGFLVDRGVDLLAERKATNVWVQVGHVRRAMGGGPDGLGWPVKLPSFSGMPEALDDILLVDQSLVIATPAARNGALPFAFVNHRNGRPARGVVAILAVSEQAVDGEGLVATLFALPLRDGQRRLGGLSPRPSVLWLLGEGEGQPLEVTYLWSSVKPLYPR